MICHFGVLHTAHGVGGLHGSESLGRMLDEVYRFRDEESRPHWSL